MTIALPESAVAEQGGHQTYSTSQTAEFIGASSRSLDLWPAISRTPIQVVSTTFNEQYSRRMARAGQQAGSARRRREAPAARSIHVQNSRG